VPLLHCLLLFLVAAARCQEDQISDLVTRLLEAKLLLPADRKFRKPKPGKKKLVKFPRTLEPAVVGSRRYYSYSFLFIFNW
jgi:hypothetical protein